MRLFLMLAISLSLLASCAGEENEDPGSKNTPDQKDSLNTISDKDAIPAIRSKITCPECGHLATETMPENSCLIRYECKACGFEMYPKEGDCCVFCSYGTHKCPSKQ